MCFNGKIGDLYPSCPVASPVHVGQYELSKEEQKLGVLQTVEIGTYKGLKFTLGM